MRTKHKNVSFPCSFLTDEPIPDSHSSSMKLPPCIPSGSRNIFAFCILALTQHSFQEVILTED